MRHAIARRMAAVRDYKELMAWQLASEMEILVRRATARPSFDRRWDLRRQLVRASESPCANLAEGFARYHPREFARFVRIAKGSLAEVLEHVRTAECLSLLPRSEADEITRLAHRALGAATGLVRYLESARPRPHDRDRPPMRSAAPRTRNLEPPNPEPARTQCRAPNPEPSRTRNPTDGPSERARGANPEREPGEP
jgi:four helix bundle protein